MLAVSGDINSGARPLLNIEIFEVEFFARWHILVVENWPVRAFLSSEVSGLTELAIWWKPRLAGGGCFSLTPSPGPAAQAVHQLLGQLGGLLTEDAVWHLP